MRRPASAWLRVLVFSVGLPIVAAGCALSLRGGVNPGSGPFATPTPFRAPGPPIASIAAPDDDSLGEVGRTIAFDVRGSDPWPVGVARLELFAGDTLVDRALAAGGASRLNFGVVMEWMPTLPGSYEVSAFAYRADGTASPPATISLTITGTPLTPSPIATPTPLTTPSPSPSASPSPSPTPTPTPLITLRPSAKPTAQPIPVRVEVWVEESDLPLWTVGTSTPLTVHVQNIGGTSVPFVRVNASLAGSSDRVATGALRPGQEVVVAVVLRPDNQGERLLKVEGRLPVGYYESDPDQNTLVWERYVIVRPPVTPEPEPTPTPEPTPEPTRNPGPP